MEQLTQLRIVKLETELMLSDLQSIESRIPIMEKKAKSGDREANELLPIINGVHDLLSNGKPARLLKNIRIRKTQIKKFTITDK